MYSTKVYICDTNTFCTNLRKRSHIFAQIGAGNAFRGFQGGRLAYSCKGIIAPNHRISFSYNEMKHNIKCVNLIWYSCRCSLPSWEYLVYAQSYTPTVLTKMCHMMLTVILHVFDDTGNIH